jgi:hypothetical protein
LAPVDTPDRLSRIGHISDNALWPATLFRHSLQILARLRQKLICLLQIITGIGQHQKLGFAGPTISSSEYWPAHPHQTPGCAPWGRGN